MPLQSPARHTARVPDRLDGLRLGALSFLCSYSNWFLLCAFLAVFLAKSFALSRIAGASHGAAWIWVLVAKDACLCFGLAAMFRAIERRVGRAAWLTALLGFLILVVSVLSVVYLQVAGELLSWQSLTVGVARFDEVRGIAAESGPVMWLAGAALFVVLAVPYSCRRRWGSGGSPHLGFGIAVVAGVIGLGTPAPEQVPVARLGENAALTAFAGYFEQPSLTQTAGLFGRYPTPVSREAITLWAQARKPPNVLFVVLESTRWDVTSLADGPADTPALAALAERGLSFQNARAVVPHTTKSLWSFLCGQYPVMQWELYEVSLSVEGQCLPHILGVAGYRRAFFQSALGSFEDRPRLVAKLGFEQFMAWEDIGGEPLGFLASDDESLTAPFLRFVDEGAGRPFFAVLLTSAPHFPYRLSKAAASRTGESRRPRASSWERYSRLIEAGDVLMTDVLLGLASRGLSENTIVVALGDHGEGFGDQGVRQHDTNFFEEGLRVPVVLAGPRIAPRVATQAASLLDLLPTLLDALELPYATSALPGQSYLNRDPAPSPKLFGCWFERKCRGFVEGNRKVVYVPERDETFTFDLAADPGEKAPLAPSARDRRTLATVNERITGLQSRTLPLVRSELSAFGAWRCLLGESCLHPASPAGGLHGAK
jgi:arylsulfatase A-like enzyme